MQFVVGLGNPGERYEFSRHNAGFMLVNFLASQGAVPWKVFRRGSGEIALLNSTTLLKPQTFMNEVGTSVRQTLQFYAPGIFRSKAAEKLLLHQLWIAYDDLDIPLGSYKIQFGKTPKVHNGVKSVVSHLGTDQFWSVRLGVDGRAGDRSKPGATYVLEHFSPEERNIFMSTLSYAARDIVNRIAVSTAQSGSVQID
jgi:PTH1 family peptidyl-tRNA hydrolase